MLAMLLAAAVLTGRASIVDGDTLEIRGERVRLWGVDAPESAQRCIDRRAKPYPCGQRAALALDQWVAARTVRCAPKDRDRYGRVVATCSVGGEDLGRWLARNGWAVDYARYSRGAYASDEAVARKSELGIWAGAFEPPYSWRLRNRR